MRQRTHGRIESPQENTTTNTARSLQREPEPDVAEMQHVLRRSARGAASGAEDGGVARALRRRAVHRPGAVLGLQRTVGNRAVQRVLARGAMSPMQLKSSGKTEENRTGMPDRLKAGLEGLSGLDLSGVRVHYNSPEPAEVEALAYTRGQDIYLGRGQERHLPHEGWHVVQQMEGRVRPTAWVNGVGVNDVVGLEREAEVMGGRALHAPPGRSQQENSEHRRLRGQELTHLVPERQRKVPLVIQRTTSIILDEKNEVDPFAVIHGVRHDRRGVGAPSRNTAMNREWLAVPAGAVCNHSVSYERLLVNLLSYAHDRTVAEFANTLLSLYYVNYESDPHGPHQVIAGMILDEHGNVDRTALCMYLDYMISKICDSPGNLFFWPRKTGGDPDFPVDVSGDTLAPEWRALPGLDLTGGHLRAALNNFRTHVEMTIGLDW